MMAETDKIPFYPKLFRTKATYEAKLAAGEIEEGSLCFIEDTKEIIAFGYGYGGSILTIDTELSDTSENPIQNKIIKSEIDTINSNIIENEEVTATALIDLDTRINEISENVSGETATKEELQQSVDSLTAIITDNEEVVATALADLNSQMENKQDALVSGNTIKTINGESILGEGNIEIQGGGGEGGTQMLEIRYNLDGTELTDEDKAINAAIYAKCIDNKNYTIQWYISSYGALLTAESIMLPTEDYPVLGLTFESDALTLLEQRKMVIELTEDGSIIANAFPAVSDMLYIEDATSYTSIMSELSRQGYGGDYYGSLPLLATTPNGVVGGTLTHISIQGTYTKLYFISLYTGNYQYIYADANTDSVSICTLTGARIYLNPSSYDVNTNKELFAHTDISNLSTAQIYYLNTYYTPISYNVIKTDNIISAYQITIYRINTFETWQINSDGTTQQITL